MNICCLSYLGDIRMFFAEDKRKVSGVRIQAELFENAFMSANTGVLYVLAIETTQYSRKCP